MVMTTYQELISHRWSETGVLIRDGSLWTPCLDCYEGLRCEHDSDSVIASLIHADALLEEVNKHVKDSLVSRQS